MKGRDEGWEKAGPEAKREKPTPKLQNKREEMELRGDLNSSGGFGGAGRRTWPWG